MAPDLSTPQVLENAFKLTFMRKLRRACVCVKACVHVWSPEDIPSPHSSGAVPVFPAANCALALPVTGFGDIIRDTVREEFSTMEDAQ